MSQYAGPTDPVWVCQDQLDLEAIDVSLGPLVGPDTITKSHKEAIRPFSVDLLSSNVSVLCRSAFISG